MGRGRNRSRRRRDATARTLARTLTDQDIVTSRGIGRRSALGLIGRGVVGGGALSLVPRFAAAQVGDGVDVTRQGDQVADSDTGPSADPPGDTDVTVLADSAAAFDNDVSRPGDAADNDVAPFADTGDNDVPTLADPKSNRPSDPADTDISRRGDPLPERVDTDPTDFAGDADQSVRGDVADQD